MDMEETNLTPSNSIVPLNTDFDTIFEEWMNDDFGLSEDIDAQIERTIDLHHEAATTQVETIAQPEIGEEQENIFQYNEFDNEQEYIVQDTSVPDVIDANTKTHTTFDNVGMLPKYAARRVERGAAEDSFFAAPLYKNMVDNEIIITRVTDGTDQDILSLPNFCVQTPNVKIKCDHALEIKLHIDCTLELICKYGVQMSSVYRRLALLSDRICLGCQKPSLKISCAAGKWRCHHCINNGKDIDFTNGFNHWLGMGCPSRHTTIMKNDNV